AKGIALGNPAPPAAALATGDFHTIGGIIRNNFVLRDPLGGGNHISLELSSAKDVKVYNNTFYSEDATYFRQISFSDSSALGVTSGIDLRNNLIRGKIADLTAARSGGWTELGDLQDIDGTVILPAWFVDVTMGDFHLTTAATGAIGQGAVLAEVTDDFDAEPRAAPIDLGADQRVAASSGGSGGAGGAAGAGGTGGAVAGGTSSGGTSGANGGSGAIAGVSSGGSGAALGIGGGTAGSAGMSSGGSSASTEEGGCGCRTASRPARVPLPVLLITSFFICRRGFRRRRRS
ncbi:MAG TPA: hypothetical protein VGJ84_14125, partial [Polyangiaceae bacterium]